MKPALIILATLAFAAATTLLRAQLIGTPTPPPDAATLAAQSVVDAINQEITHRVAVHQTCFNTVWRNERPGATPAAVLAAMGNNAKLVFAFANANLDHISQCAQLVGKTLNDFIAPQDYTPPLAFTINDDGTATINQ
jgi:hypothetical protein